MLFFFASICTFSLCYILFFDKKNTSKKKIDREIEEAIKKINETSVVLNNDNDDDYDGFITKK